TGQPAPAPGQSGALFLANGNTIADLAFGADGLLYVASYHEYQIKRYDPATGQARPAAGQSGAVWLTLDGKPRGLAFGPDGNLYVATNDGNGAPGVNAVKRYDGKTGAALPAPGQTGATYLTVPAGATNRPLWLQFNPLDGYLYIGTGD